MAGSFWVILLTNLANSSLCGRQRATHAPAGILTKPRARNQFPAVSTSNRLVSCSALPQASHLGRPQVGPDRAVVANGGPPHRRHGQPGVPSALNGSASNVLAPDREP